MRAQRSCELWTAVDTVAERFVVKDDADDLPLFSLRRCQNRVVVLVKLDELDQS
jgi:hypothetical protein